MSWGNTKVPTMEEAGGKHQYQLPKRRDEVTHQMTYYFTDELEARFRDYYPRYTNRQMMQFFGVSFSTIERFRKVMGLEKDMVIIHRKTTEKARRTCEKNGYYDRLRGHAPSPQCMEATRAKRATGWHPFHSLKEKSPRKYAELCKGMRERRLKLEAEERWRLEVGLKPKTRIHRPAIKFTRQQVCLRSKMMNQYDYILGDMSDTSGERMAIYYDGETTRRPLLERHATEIGFRILPLPEEERECLYHFQ